MFKKILVYNASPVTGELAEIFIDLFRKQNFETNQINDFNNFDDNILYFIICPAGLKRYDIKPKNYIIYQLESYLYKDYNMKWMKENFYLEYLKNAIEVWDYSEYNIKYLNSIGIYNTKYVPIGYHYSLNSDLKINIDEKDIDVLFLGGISFPRRINIYNALKEMKYNVVMVEGKSHKEIISLINRSKISLNIHAFGPNILETVRLSLLLSNKTCVISEVSSDKEIEKKYEDGGVIFCEYENIIQTTHEYLQNISEIETISEKSYEWYKNNIFNIPDLKHNKWTFVTAFIDVSEYDDDYEQKNRNPEEYLRLSTFVTSLDIPMIIYCSPKFVNIIRDNRSKFQSKTEIVPYRFENLPKSEYFNLLRDERRKVCKMPNKYSGGYYLLVNSKLDFVKNAIEKNPFSSDYFAWIDFGLNYLCSSHPEFPTDITSMSPDKINIMSIGRVNENEVFGENLNLFLKTDSWKTSAQFFYTNKENFLWFSEKFDEMFNYCIERKIIVLEEKIFGAIIAQNRDYFNVWIGRYVDCLKNSYRPRGSFDLIFDRIKIEQDLGNNDEAFRLAKYLYLSKNEISIENLFNCLDFIVINAYYIDQIEEGKNACQEMIKLGREDFNIMVKLRNDERYANNFKFYDEYLF